MAIIFKMSLLKSLHGKDNIFLKVSHLKFPFQTSKQTVSSSDSDKAPDTKENEATTLMGSTHEAKRKQLHPNKVRVLIGAFSIKVFFNPFNLTIEEKV